MSKAAVFFYSLKLPIQVLEHSLNVQQIALAVARRVEIRGKHVDKEFISNTALLHDVGRKITHGPSHGIEGAKLLENAGFGPRMQHACLAHFLAGMTKEEADSIGLPLKSDIQLNSLEEKIIVYADYESSANKLSRVACHTGKGINIYPRMLKLKSEIEELMGGEMEKVQDFDVMVLLKNAKAEYLLLKRTDLPVWEFPGGGIEWGESPEDAARRECDEECGLKIETGKCLGATSAVFEKRGKLKHAVYLVFEGKVKSGKVRLSREHTEFKWVKKKELASENLGFNSKLALGLI